MLSNFQPILLLNLKMLLLTSWWHQIMLCLPSLCVQIYSNRELEDQLTKIREMLSDDKHDWEHRVVAVRVLSNTHKKNHTVEEPGNGIQTELSCLLLVLCS